MSAEDEELEPEIEKPEEGDNTPDNTAEGTSEVEYTEFEKKQYDRAKKATAELKEAKKKIAELEKAPKPTEVNNLTPALNSELIAKEVRLLAALTDEEIAEAKVISKGRDISLEEALKTKIFKAFQKELKDEERKEKAKLGASKGSGQEEETAEFHPGMSEKEHKEAWKKAVGR